MALSLNQALSLKPVADFLNVELAALVAVVEVESGGQIFAPSSIGEDMPVIRWEGHYFYKLLKGEAREIAVKLGLAAPKAGTVKNPKSQDGRYLLLAKAIEINEDAAYASISIGVGQVMGAHYAKLGYFSARAMFAAAKKGLIGQVEIMGAYIETFDLTDELQRRDWSAFARGYNGPAYAKNAYDTKMASAYQRALALLGATSAAAPKSAHTMLRMGSSGEGVREVQQLLRRAGMIVTVDGDFGPSTRDAVRQFQSDRSLSVDGVVGPATFSALQEFKIAPDETPGAQKFTEIPETTTGTIGAGGGIGVTVAADKLNEVADKIAGGGETFALISNGLYLLGGVLVVGGIIWTAWGYIKSRRTREGLA